MEKQNYWVVIPSKLYFEGKKNKDIQGLYALVSSLTKKEGYCYASNQRLADVIGVSNPTVRRWLKELQGMNYIRCDYDEKLKNSDKRKIYINGEWGVSSNNDETGLIKKAAKRGDGSHQKGGFLMTNIKRDIKNDMRKEVPPTNFSFKEELEKLLSSKRKDLQIIGLYVKYKDIKLENPEQLSGLICRNVRAAKNLEGYSNEKILETFEYMDSVKIKGEYMQWTLETTAKFITGEL